jgi:hypothetical protein
MRDINVRYSALRQQLTDLWRGLVAVLDHDPEQVVDGPKIIDASPQKSHSLPPWICRRDKEQRCFIVHHTRAARTGLPGRRTGLNEMRDRVFFVRRADFAVICDLAT